MTHATVRIGRKEWTALFLLTAVLVTPLWASSSAIGVAPWLSYLVILAIVTFAPAAEGRGQSSEPIAGRGAFEAGLVSALLIAPAALFLIVTWRQEFPWLGDHDYHLLQSEISFEFWKTYFVPVVLVIGVAAALAGRSARSSGPLVACALAIGAGWFVDADLYFSIRYPGTFYFIAAPLIAIAHGFSWTAPLNAMRLANVLAIPAWLFVIRPLVVRRWPDRTLLPFGCFLFLQKDLVYYFASPYLEPWALVILATAIEHLLRFGGDDVWRVYLLIGLAAAIKEQAILVLPFVVLITIPWRRRSDRNELLLTALAAGSPFVLYYLLRNASHVWRTAGLAPWSEIASGARLREMAHRALLQFDIALIAVLVAIVLCLWLVVFGPKQRRAIFAALLAAALFQIAFFYSDWISVFWTGYPRFQLFALVLIGSPLLWLGQMMANRRWAPALVSTAILALNLVPLVPSLVLAAGPDPRRNFSEHLDAPIYYPLRSMIASANRMGALEGKSQLRVLDNIQEVNQHVVVAGQAHGPYELTALPQAYPDLAKRLLLHAEAFAEDAEDRCRCRSEVEANAAVYVFFTALGVKSPERAAMERQARRCTDALQRSCRTTFVLTDKGQLVGAFGSGLRK